MIPRTPKRNPKTLQSRQASQFAPTASLNVGDNAGNFLSGNHAVVDRPSPTPVKSSAFGTGIDVNWEAKSLGFAVNKKNKFGGLCGLKVIDPHPHDPAHGLYTEEINVRGIDASQPLSIVKVTPGQVHAEQLNCNRAGEFVIWVKNSNNVLRE